MRPETELDDPVSKRFDFLETLVEESATKPELVDRLDASRSTVDRAIDALEAADIVERTDSRYEPTVIGVHAYRQHQTYLQRLADLERAADPLLELAPDDGFDPVVLEGADVYTPEPHAPEEVFERDLHHVTNASAIRGVSPVVLPRFVDVLRAGVIERNLTFELVLTPEVYESLLTTYGDVMEEIERQGRFSPLRYDGSVPYTFWIAETPAAEWLGLVTYSETGIGGLVVNDSPEAVAWGQDRYEDYSGDAEPVSFLD